MNRFILTLSAVFVITTICSAQQPVQDAYPNATISAIDYQSGQQYLVNSDDAILFKDAFIRLVINTPFARMSGARFVAGHKTMVISQADPQTNGLAFQLSLQNTFLKQTTVIYSFVYNVDQNTLYAYDNSSGNWVPQAVQGANVVNLNACLAYGKFNDPGSQDMANGDYQQEDDYDSPVDTAVEVAQAPPELPEYEQPECPADGYLWQPGYWSYSLASNNYYWVPGVWVAPPNEGYLWTPPYWGFYGGRYRFHHGYWGPTVGFYGGINYGYGYIGIGFVGGEWRDRRFRYNTAVVRVNRTVVRNTYVNTTVINRTTVVNNRVSYNGPGGVTARPNSREIEAEREHHVTATPEQNRNQRAARVDKAQFASSNGDGRPANLAAPKAPDRLPPNNSGNRPGINAPARTGNNPNTPSANPNSPGNNPNSPGRNGRNPNNPNANPNTPSVTPNAPTVNPNTPSTNPNSPGRNGRNPNAPANNPNAPTNPNTPTVNPNTPAVNPNTPLTNPNSPGRNGRNPNAPANNPNTPPTNPNAPAVSPNTPAVNPNAPSTNPNTPRGNGRNPNAPTNNPNVPAANPNAPSANPNPNGRNGRNPNAPANLGPRPNTRQLNQPKPQQNRQPRENKPQKEQEKKNN
jgi:hypothetical protein